MYFAYIYVYNGNHTCAYVHCFDSVKNEILENIQYVCWVDDAPYPGFKPILKTIQGEIVEPVHNVSFTKCSHNCAI